MSINRNKQDKFPRTESKSMMAIEEEAVEDEEL
jgi:hypothetical protein